ncbi:acyltransferase [Trichocoleus sp. FACHB-262]|uniref:acyltransferase family protein n=1 Tax=Trichocoleus sp. FACHB-262 TaxID=2692869 RepID=UPI0016866A5B|nr:acyltransferase [Trichocoleus sp. FACHB-262]MBD2121768.1 acyltransferase [Trichocoleus sp. FACHB-262]
MNCETKVVRKRLDWIDQTKGIAILAVILFHFFQNYPERFDLVVALDRNGARFGYAAVDIFFVMAGFNTSYALASALKTANLTEISVDWKLWLKKRISRLYPTYFLAVVSSLMLYQWFGHLKINSIQNFILSCIGLAGYEFQSINPGFWFFTVILEAYLSIPLIFYFCRGQTVKILGLGILVAALTKALCWVLPQSSPSFWFLLQNNFLGSYFFQLCLGLYWGVVYFEKQSFRRIDWLAAIGTFVIGIVICAGMVLGKANITYMFGFDVLLSPILFLGLYALLQFLSQWRSLQWGMSFLSLLGLYSYQLYLIHQPLFVVALRRLNQLLDLPPYLQLGFSVLVVGLLLTIYGFLFVKTEVFIRKQTRKLVSSQA